MKRRLFLLAALAACGDDASPDAGAFIDSGAFDAREDVALTDSAPADAERDAGADGGAADAAMDAGPMDGGPQPRVVESGAYHVAEDGDDGNDGRLVSEGGTGAWRTLAHAIVSLAAGDLLYVHEGRHMLEDLDLKFMGESGTEEAPIVVAGFPGETATLDGGGGVGLRLDGKSFWTFEHLSIENYTSFFVLGEDIAAEHNTFRFLHARTGVGGDNTGVVRMSPISNFTTVENCDIAFTSDPTMAHQNTGGIWLTAVEAVTLRRNRIDGFPIGIYWKHRNNAPGDGANTDILIAENYITGCTRNAMQLNAKHALVRDNIFGEGNRGVRVNEANGRDGGDHNVFEHNLFFETGLGLSGDAQDDPLPGAQQNIVRDNIFVGASLSIAAQPDGVMHGTQTHHNLYGTVAVRSAGEEYDLGAWVSFYGMDMGSLSGSPRFVGGDRPTGRAGFVLEAGSLGTSAASDGGDMGPRL